MDRSAKPTFAEGSSTIKTVCCGNPTQPANIHRDDFFVEKQLDCIFIYLRECVCLNCVCVCMWNPPPPPLSCIYKS